MLDIPAVSDRLAVAVAVEAPAHHHLLTRQLTRIVVGRVLLRLVWSDDLSGQVRILAPEEAYVAEVGSVETHVACVLEIALGRGDHVCAYLSPLQYMRYLLNE